MRRFTLRHQGLENEYEGEPGRSHKQSVRNRMYKALLAQLGQEDEIMWQHHILFSYNYLLSRMIFIPKVVNHNNTYMCVDEEGILEGIDDEADKYEPKYRQLCARRQLFLKGR